jgi:hypothetical protein
MCFYDDGDWTAQVVEDEILVVTAPVKCDECRRPIKPGEWRRHVFMQEHEVCRHNPAHDDYDGPETDSEDCPEGCEHDFGETFDYDRCQSCDQLIEAIHRHELAVGCHEYESRPSLTELHDAMVEGDGEAYLAKAEELFPGITARSPETFLRFRSVTDDAGARVVRAEEP